MSRSQGHPVRYQRGWRSALPRSIRPGFTLVEILLALGLMMVVLTAALAGMVLLQNITIAGRARAEQAQLARAIERQMRSDIRCVLFQPQVTEVEEEEDQQTSTQYATVNEDVGAADDPGGTTTVPADESGANNSGSTTTGSTSSSSTAANSSTTSSTTPTGAFTSQSMGVFGNATVLVLHVSKPSRESARSLGTLARSATASGSTSTAGPISQLSDLRSISYFLASAGGGGLQGAVGNSAAGGSALFATEAGAQGLARLEGNRLKIQQADAAGNLNLLAQQANVLAPEVTELQFRYFNGQSWVTAWDSVTLNALPRAIEVTMRIGPGPDAEAAASPLATNSTAAPSVVYRFVVSLPLSDRTLGSLPAGGY